MIRSSAKHPWSHEVAPLAEFDSIQDLATLGSIVPLVYTRRQDGHGGVRAESQLLWSRMRNNTTYQELRALLLFSAGEIDVIPDYKGYAFGDSKLNGYSAPDLALVQPWVSQGRWQQTLCQPRQLSI